MLKRLQNEKGSSLIEKLTAISQLLNTNKQKNSPSIFHSMCLHSPINKSNGKVLKMQEIKRITLCLHFPYTALIRLKKVEEKHVSPINDGIGVGCVSRS
ncbi:hypothetical protein YC2023_087807 [Brassica napus]